ncbi:DNA topoisomerase 2-like [Cornus florida]|uniref:DNA topoisomerase 2-like n=1 Tax=Cornus florida TaxID=4283 RepID=UPI00289FBEE7|nr:DNA topoisomerase 2-like [Cornus florida]XP_059652557.1 DNA topoisomerase 2-like [Cornus florida]XP_059652558.1 DNA topoisomerase 2-like [Cornus florida]
MPIIPMVLVNRSTEVIVTGDRSYIPIYNPTNIVSNLRCLLNDKPMQPMQPWYKGFRGNIKKAAADGYTIEGLIEEVDATTLRITELPIGVSSQDYIDFLRSMTTGNDPFIKDYIERFAADTTVNFEVILPAENLSMAKHEGLLKKFKLTSTIKTSNMRLFNREGMIKKYDTPIQILEEFIPIRLEFYEKRKKYVLCNLEMELLKLENKVKYVTEVLEGKISFFQGNIDSLVMLLKAKDFMTLGKITNTPEAAVPEEDYEYILRMPLLTLTNDGYKELCYTGDMLKNRVNDLKDETPKSMWLKDLGSFEKYFLRV